MLLGRRSIESSKPDAQSARLELNNPLAKILIKEKCDHIFAKNVKFEDEEFLAHSKLPNPLFGKTLSNKVRN